jgi:hypothetical protein
MGTPCLRSVVAVAVAAQQGVLTGLGGSPENSSQQRQHQHQGLMRRP